jgi:hypothetical protein
MNTRSIRRRIDDVESSSGANAFLCLMRFDDETREQAIEHGIAEGTITKRDQANRYIAVMNERDARL